MRHGRPLDVRLMNVDHHVVHVDAVARARALAMPASRRAHRLAHAAAAAADIVLVIVVVSVDRRQPVVSKQAGIVARFDGGIGRRRRRKVSGPRYEHDVRFHREHSLQLDVVGAVLLLLFFSDTLKVTKKHALQARTQEMKWGVFCKKVKNAGIVKSEKLGWCFVKKWKMGVFFVKKVKNGSCFFVKKSGPFLNAGCIMYSISIFYFTFYFRVRFEPERTGTPFLFFF